MEQEVYIHVGYPKCASTFLQRNVFPYMQDIHLIHKNMKNKYSLVHWDAVSLCKLSPGKNLISSEQLTGSNSIHDHYESGLVIADRLKALYPNAKIILIERERYSWLHSLYMHFLIDSRKSNLIKDYYAFYYNHLDKDLLRFDEYRDKLYDTFDDVLVLQFADLKEDNRKFIQDICDFMGVEFPEDYNKNRAMVGLKSRHIKLVRIMGLLRLHNFNSRYVLGFLRRINI